MACIVWTWLAMMAVSFVEGQLNVTECIGRCNLAIGLQTTDNAVNDRVNIDIGRALVLTAYSSSNCVGNVGVVFYTDDIKLVDYCPVYPYQPVRKTKLDCVKDAGLVQSHSSSKNLLHVVLNHICNTADAFQFTHPRVCRYTIAIIANKQINDNAKALTEAATCHSKGCIIYCFLVGNGAISNEYNQICNGHIKIYKDYPNLWQGVENMYASLQCCDPPVPIPTTTTTTPTTTTTTPTTTTPTTTTTTPTTTTTTLTTTTPTTTSAPPSPCDGCKIINGVGYKNHPERCDCWLRCLFRKGGMVYNITNCCGCGMFWNQRLLTCIPLRHSHCQVDRCKGQGVTNWPYTGNCRAYWTCDGVRSSDALCCGEGEMYERVTQQCVSDINGDCNDRCPCEQETTSVYCSFLPNTADNRTYLIRGFNTMMHCPPGTLFNPLRCMCSTFTPVKQHRCPADFDLRCTEDPAIDHANNAFIQNIGVIIQAAASTCSFDGNDRFLVPRYSNYDWRKRFAIFAKFNGKSNPNDNTPLVSNTDCAEPSSVELRLVRGPNGESYVEAYIKTNQRTFTVRVLYKENEMNEAYMYYDGTNLYLCVKYENGAVVSNSVSAKGHVLRCKCAVQIGYGWKNRYFKGLIDDVRIYINCIPKNFCPS